MLAEFAAVALLVVVPGAGLGRERVAQVRPDFDARHNPNPAPISTHSRRLRLVLAQ